MKTLKKRIYDVELKSGFILTVTAKNIREAKTLVNRQLRLSGDNDRIDSARFSQTV